MQGIYKITNTENGQVYIGRSTDIENRWKQHQEAVEFKISQHHKMIKKGLNNNEHSNYRCRFDWQNKTQISKFSLYEAVCVL